MLCASESRLPVSVWLVKRATCKRLNNSSAPTFYAFLGFSGRSYEKNFRNFTARAASQVQLPRTASIHSFQSSSARFRIVMTCATAIRGGSRNARTKGPWSSSQTEAHLTTDNCTCNPSDVIAYTSVKLSAWCRGVYPP